jgi:hypothetical protein
MRIDVKVFEEGMKTKQTVMDSQKYKTERRRYTVRQDRLEDLTLQMETEYE